MSLRNVVDFYMKIILFAIWLNAVDLFPNNLCTTSMHEMSQQTSHSVHFTYNKII